MAKEFKELTRDQVYAEEDALIDFQFALMDAMREKGVTKAELADALGVSRARVSQLFSPAANPTLKLAARALHALGMKSAYHSNSGPSEEKDACASVAVTADMDLVEIDSLWLGEVVTSTARNEDVSAHTMKWFACQHRRREPAAWHRKDGRVANSNGDYHAMEAA
jgi:transcriptional regulator with XRE-family HTH domain